MIQRRGLLAGLGALLAAPAIIRTPGLLMSVRPHALASAQSAILDVSALSHAQKRIWARDIWETTREFAALSLCDNDGLLRVSSRARTAGTMQTQWGAGFMKLVGSDSEVS